METLAEVSEIDDTSDLGATYKDSIKLEQFGSESKTKSEAESMAKSDEEAISDEEAPTLTYNT